MWLVFLGTCFGFACVSTVVFACASHKKGKDEEQRGGVDSADGSASVSRDRGPRFEANLGVHSRNDWSQLPRKRDCENIHDTVISEANDLHDVISDVSKPATVSSRAIALPQKERKTSANSETPPSKAENLPPSTKALVITYPTYNHVGSHAFPANSNVGGTKPMPHFQQPIFQRYPPASSTLRDYRDKDHIPKDQPVPHLVPPRVAHVPQSPDTGPITRLVPTCSVQRPAQKVHSTSTAQICQTSLSQDYHVSPPKVTYAFQPRPEETRHIYRTTEQHFPTQTSSASVRHTTHRHSCGQCPESCPPSSFNVNTMQGGLAKDHENTRTKTNRAAPTPIVVLHPAHHNRLIQTNSYSRHYNLENRTQRSQSEDGKKEDTYNEENEEEKRNSSDEEERDDLSQNDDGDSNTSDKSRENENDDEDEEDFEAATLDLRGLFVREALTAVTVFLREQDKEYINSGFQEGLRFVYIITGWGKLSPGHVPKLKPAVEDLLSSASYKMDYKYIWTNNGEMQVDLIRRKEVAELRKRSEERMKQRKRQENLAT